MKQILIILSLLWITLGISAQQYPPEWVKFTYGEYLYDIQSDSNDRNQSETDFKNYLLNIARTNLAKQIQIRVKDIAELNKTSVNGKTNITYSAKTSFATDVNMKLVETKSVYYHINKMGYAIAYINREKACNYYKNELTLVYNKINNSITLTENYISAGFKDKAKKELEASLRHFSSVDEPLLMMSVFGASQQELTDWQERINMAEQKIKRMIADMKHGTVICLNCNADIFGKSYPKLQNELKGILASRGCSFTNNPDDADWVITVTCSAREYSNVNAGKASSYFSYVDAAIVIDKVVTSQRIFEDEISVKGGHTFGYEEAAKDAYKEIKQKLGNIIQENVK